MSGDDENNRFMTRLGDALTHAVTRNLLDVLAPTPPPPQHQQPRPIGLVGRPRNEGPRPAGPLQVAAAAAIADGIAAAAAANRQVAGAAAAAPADDTIFIDDDDDDGILDLAEQDARRVNEVYIGKFPSRAHRSHLERLLFEHLGLAGSPSDIIVVRCTRNPTSSYALVTLSSRADVETLLALSPINFLGGDVTVDLSNYASQARQRTLSFLPPRRGGSTPARRQSSTDLPATPTRRDRRSVTTTGAAHASLRKQVMDRKNDLKRQFKTKYHSLQEEMNTLEVKQREAEAEKDRLENDLATVKRNLAGLSSQKETLLQRFCQNSEAHDAELQELDRTLALLQDEEDVQEDPGEAAEMEGVQQQAEEATAGLRNRMNDALECPCCFEDMRAEIFQCRRGHLICGSCLRRLRDCPVCRTKYPADPIRALFAEQMAQNLANNSTQN